MTSELLKALFTIYSFCIDQNNCKNCPLSEFCGKLPSEW